MGVTMPQNDRPSACPSCAEPLEEDDLFCGACGTDLRPAKPTGPPVPPAPPAVPGDGSQPAPPAASPSGIGDFDPAPPAPSAPGEAPPTEAPAEPEAAPTTPDASEEGGPRCVACGGGPVGVEGFCEHCGHKQPVARDHWEREVGGVAAASDRGLRHRRNEDFFTVASATAPDGRSARIAVVCDGVSSAQRSDQASEAASEAAGASMREALPRGVHAQQAMHDALVAAAGAVDALATEEERAAQHNAPACTIVAAVVSTGLLTVGWIGDSRAYWVPDERGAQPARLTEDDSWAAQMVAAGLMTEAEAYADARAHAITGWLGADAYELDPHTASFEPDRAGVVIVCSDGLWNYAETAAEMAAAVPADAADRPLAAARHLVGFALDGGGHDNVTVAVVPFATRAETESSA